MEDQFLIILFNHVIRGFTVIAPAPIDCFNVPALESFCWRNDSELMKDLLTHNAKTILMDYILYIFNIFGIRVSLKTSGKTDSRQGKKFSYFAK